MARVTTGYTFGLNVPDTCACEMLAMGKSEKEILELIYKVKPDAPVGERQKAARYYHKLLENPKFQECFRTIVRQRTMPAYGKAASKLMEQIDDESGWLANKAANDILTRFGPMIMGEEDRQIVVKVEGMPEMGAPTSDE